MLVACNGIIGLDDYARVECTGGRCDGGTDGPGVDAGRDGTVADAEGTRPVSWARFKMPNYVEPDGPDANLTSYSPAAGGFLDNVSRLVWREPIPLGERGGKTWEEAQAICARATDGGGRWRLPSRIELVTLLDLTKSPKIDPTFSTTDATAYWTTSEVRPITAGTPRKHWTVEFGAGGLGAVNEDGERAAVRCIKAQ
jgi:hypothetical protein